MHSFDLVVLLCIPQQTLKGKRCSNNLATEGDCACQSRNQCFFDKVTVKKCGLQQLLKPRRKYSSWEKFMFIAEALIEQCCLCKNISNSCCIYQ